MLTNIQRAELEELGAPTVRMKLTQLGAGQGAALSGFKCGDITRGDVEDWLSGKNAEEGAHASPNAPVAVIAGVAGIVSVIVGIASILVPIWLAK